MSRLRFRLGGLAAVSIALGLISSAHAGRTLHVDQNHPQASDDGSGGESSPFRTISAATAQAGPGDTIYVQPGIYREHVAPARGGTKDAPITWQAAPGHRVFVRGSEEWRPEWKPIDGRENVYEAMLDPALFEANKDVTNPRAPVLTNPYHTAVVIGRNLPSIPARPVSAWTETTEDWLAGKDPKRAGADANLPTDEEPAGKEPGRRPKTLGQLFVDGSPLAEAETREAVLTTPGTWIVNDEGTGLLVHFSPASTPLESRFVELTVRDRVFAPARRGLRHLVVRGFVFEHAANQGPFPQGGLFSLRAGSNWLVEDNIIRHAKTVGIDVGSETWDGNLLPRTVEEERELIIAFDNTFRGNRITDNGLSGMAGWNCPRIVIENNIIERNNRLGFRPLRVDHWVVWEEHAGIKLHVAKGARIAGNLVQDNDAHGIWIDNVFTNARITRNTVLNNAGGGIMMELGHGPGLIDNNVVAFTRAFNAFYAGDGIYGHDASNITVAHNLSFANARYGIFFQRLTDRLSVTIGKTRGDPSREPVQASGLRILNNLLLNNGRGPLCLPGYGDRTKDNISDYNYISASGTRFFLNDGRGSVVKGPVPDRVRELLSADKTGAASRKDYEGWTLADGLTPAEWRLVTGNDLHSVIGDPRRLVVRPFTREIELQMSPDSELSPVPAVPLPEWVAGPPLPSGPNVLPGPWQNLDGINRRFFLWPVSNKD